MMDCCPHRDTSTSLMPILPPCTPVLIFRCPCWQRMAVERRKERKEMFYLTTLSTHFIYGYMASAVYTVCKIRLTQWPSGSVRQPVDTAVRWKEGKVLFNDALNTFYLRLYGVRHMVKDHSDSEGAIWATLSD